MFFVTFHGGPATKTVPDPINTIVAYDDDGNQVAASVLSGSETLDELRGVYLVPGAGGASASLYVVNGSKHTSNILCYTGSGTSFGSPVEFASAATTPAINHPFAAAFDGSGTWYVSNQDTNVVAALTAPAGSTQASAAPLGGFLNALYPGGSFLHGTLIASAVTGLPDVASTTKVPKELGGLDAILDDSDAPDPSDKSGKKSKPKVSHSVRDVQYYTFTFNSQNVALLFVVDEAEQLVRIYDPVSGQPLRCSNPLPASPTHLLINAGTLYVGVGSQVWSSPIPNPYDPKAPIWVFTPIPSLSNLAGEVSDMAFDSKGNFHVAIRTKNTVMKYDSNFANPTPWPATMTDNPEFLLHIPD
jgi:hypothetical protein